MKKLSRNMIMISAICVYLWFFWHYELFRLDLRDAAVSDIVIVFALIAMLSGLIASAVGIMMEKAWARKTFTVLNGIYLMFGLYLAYFSWNFYLFRVPTWFERLENAQEYIAIGVVVPLALFYYLKRSEKR
ncbi:MAG: hypothetical protein PHP46_01845 [Candidatus Omnitrophica bacterium]|nr:hypothetical protein [Candidatus Omnitrophota bacterium]